MFQLWSCSSYDRRQMWGYINTKGEYVVEPKFDNANSFSDGIAWIKIDGKIGYINTKG